MVDLYNGCKTANLKAGSLQPLSTSIVATNYTLQKERYTYPVRFQNLNLCVYRFTSRAVLVPYESPSLASTTDEEEKAFMKLDSIISSGELPSAIGWAIGCGCHLAQKKSDILDMCHKLKGAFSGRVLKNWGTVYFLDQVIAISVNNCWSLHAASAGR